LLRIHPNSIFFHLHPCIPSPRKSAVLHPQTIRCPPPPGNLYLLKTASKPHLLCLPSKVYKST
jgi:hypothetical protein